MRKTKLHYLILIVSTMFVLASCSSQNASNPNQSDAAAEVTSLTSLTETIDISEESST